MGIGTRTFPYDEEEKSEPLAISTFPAFPAFFLTDPEMSLPWFTQHPWPPGCLF
jgi:hypothetical protein